MISSLKSKFNFFNKRVILLGASRFSVYHWINGKQTKCYIFDKDDNGKLQFERYLIETELLPTHILVDVLEEEFRIDSIPHVMGGDRQALIDRKLDRLFRDSAYSHAIVQQRDKAGRKDDQVLLMSLPNKELLTPWLQLLEKYKVPVTGISSIVLPLQEVLKDIAGDKERGLLVSLQSISGLRQSFFLNNEIKMSRLSRMPRYSPNKYADKISEEVDKVIRYLNSLRMLSFDNPLDVYFLVNIELKEKLSGLIGNSSQVKYHFIDINENVEQQERLPHSFSDRIITKKCFEKKPECCYASKKDKRYQRMRMIKNTLYTSSTLLFLLSILLGSIFVIDALKLNNDTSIKTRQADVYRKQYEVAKEDLPETPINAYNMEAAVKLSSELNDAKSTPMPMLSFLGSSLLEFPSIKLRNIKWEIDSVVEENVNIAEEEDAGVYQIATINAKLEPFDGNYREAIVTVHEYAEELLSNEKIYDVNIIDMPLDISSSNNLQGGAVQQNADAEFSIQAIVKK